MTSLTETFNTSNWDEITRYLRVNYLADEKEKARREKAARRHRFYMSAGDGDMVQFIEDVIKDKTVRDKRIEFVEHSKFNNVLRRVTHEIASCYAMPATRTVADSEGNQRYQDLQRACRQDEVMLRVNRLAVLHRNLAIGPRIRNTRGKPEPVLDVVTPDSLHAVAHPEDPLSLSALIIDVNFKPLNNSGRLPAKVVWSAGEWFYTDEAGVMIGQRVPHTYGRIPWSWFSIEPPSSCLIDCTTGDDLEAAHRSVWFLAILLLKEAKSATKQHVYQGDLTRILREQAADTDVPIEAPEGTQVTTIDNSMDLALFTRAIDTVYETAAANHGLPPSVLKHDGVQSAEARELVRVPLREIRLQQQIPFRDLERDLAELQALVIGAQMPEFRFSTDGWAIDFADPQTPLGTKESLEVFKQERELGLTSTLAEVMRRNPDLDREAAEKILKEWGEDEDRRIARMKNRMAMQGAMAVGTREATQDPAAQAEGESMGRAA